MNILTHPVRLVSSGIAAALLAAAPTAASAHDPGRSVAGAGHLVFVQTAEAAGNTVIEYERTRSGGLVELGAYPTGGAGGTLGGAVADQLASEGSLTYDASTRLLYAVNSGSSTVTVFAVQGDRLVRRQVVASGGDFPVSVTARGTDVYVLNARAGGSLQGFVQIGGHLTAVPSWHRELGFDPHPVPEFTATPAEVAFTPDASKLVVSTKLDGNSVLVFPLGRHGPSATPVVNTHVGAVPFGFVFDRSGNLVLTEAGPGTVSTYRILRDGTLRTLDTEVTGGAAVCWVTGANGTFYVSNTGSGSISIYGETGAGDLSKRGDVPTGAGPVDSTVSSDGSYLYVETGVAAGVDVFRIGPHGSLTKTVTVSVPGAAGGQGIVAL
ncbi:MAG TPA: hypothetical protein VGC04_09050 [Cellulomonas sp.]